MYVRLKVSSEYMYGKILIKWSEYDTVGLI